jgi:ammonia channel protein AmtB
MIGSVIYSQTRIIINRFEIDDPLGVTEVHGACGFWSLIALGLFDLDHGLLITGDAIQLGI